MSQENKCFQENLYLKLNICLLALSFISRRFHCYGWSMTSVAHTSSTSCRKNAHRAASLLALTICHIIVFTRPQNSQRTCMNAKACGHHYVFFAAQISCSSTPARRELYSGRELADVQLPLGFRRMSKIWPLRNDPCTEVMKL